MMSVAELLVERVARVAQRRIAWLVTPDRGPDNPEAEREWQLRMDLAGVTAEIDAELTGNAGSDWRGLIALFGLTDAEADLLCLALALDVEPALAAVYADAQGAALGEGVERSCASEPLVKRLFGHGPKPIWRPSSPLAVWSLITPVTNPSLTGRQFVADGRITDLLFGTLSVSQELLLALETVEATPVPPSWPVALTAERLAEAVGSGDPIRSIVVNEDERAQISFAVDVAAQLGRQCVIVDPVGFDGSEWARAFMLAQRFALLGDVALIWRAGGPTWPRKIPLAPLQFVCAKPDAATPTHERSIDLVTTLPALSTHDKADVWRNLAGPLAEDAVEVGTVAGVHYSDLVEASRKPLQSLSEVADDLRARARTRMDGAGRIVDPVFSWDDLVIAENVASALRRVSFEARTRATLLESEEVARLFTSSAGLSALFWGPPGVGKSMAAEVIANDLGVNLLVVDLAATMSKYIGETAKNLSAVFAEAKASGAALIFEEADTFFAKRGAARDTSDHYRNGDTNHLLQLLDNHDSLVMLSTNDRSSIDPAFIRRLRHVIEFPLPDAPERQDLWDRMLTAFQLNAADLHGTVEDLATVFALSPAQIKSATLTACYAAEATGTAVTFQMLEEGAQRELIKEGRPGVTSNRRVNTSRRSRGETNGAR